eukprot:CAMPEP_0195523502 /NCGR_PEP_ID=MMETSP0794_2-20130614/22742_1 /TAXON_ID=515487 /ORGANISM="Stephanopyxis turris, Strain CCMP 815" /LENGTH=397 /DNA_ID=CAMNT_0040653517 /DNA_START=384 /DNA_END=1578 /DNA_ORIENTATION=+
MEGCYFDEPVPYIRGISEEEAYERQRNGTKACKKTGGTSTRSKYVSRIAKKEAESASKTKKNSIRNAKEREQRRQRKYEVKEGKLAAEMERAPAANKTLKRGIAARKERPRVVGGAAVLSAQELGIESEAMYDRLLQIMDGEDIRPEDFDLLLQLDKKNVISTMDEAKVSQFEILVIGVEDGEQRKSCTAAKGRDDGNSDGIRNVISRESLDDGFCLICLERFREMADGTELRRLPCEHVYCRPCIDQWLQNNSIKCPELSCFWNKEDEERSKQQQPREHNLVDTQQEERNEDTTDPNTNSNNDDDPDESHHSISERLWHVADVETFLDRTSGEGDLSSSVVLELLTDLATTTQHGPTLDRLQEFWEEEEDDENARNDLLLDIYCRFHSHFTTNPNT